MSNTPKPERRGAPERPLKPRSDRPQGRSSETGSSESTPVPPGFVDPCAGLVFPQRKPRRR